MKKDPRALARATTSSLLSAVYEGVPCLVVDSPPGAGKTTLGLDMSATAWGRLKESVMVATWTNRQAIDFAERLALRYSKIPVTLFIREQNQLLVPDHLWRRDNFHVVSKTAEVSNTGVVVSNASKWTASPLSHRYEWLFVDEAYQLPEFKFRRLAPLAERYVLVGDPGQIPPLIQSDVSPWGCDADGPQVSCPQAVRARHSSVPVENLPVSWRLPSDSTELVRDAFYTFDFSSGDCEGERRLELDSGDSSSADKALNSLAQPGVSYTGTVLDDDKVGTDVDPEIAEFISESVLRTLQRRGRFFEIDSGRMRLLQASDIGVVAAHRAQVAEIDKCLRTKGVPTGDGGTVVETTERWQGLERAMMIVHHPLAGLESLSSFDLDRGRLCVMLSRHHTACLIVGREGTEHSLSNHPHDGERFPGTEDDEYLGWYAHKQIWDRLGDLDRLVSV